MLSGNEINATLLALWKGNCLLQQPLIHYIIITIPWFFLVIISVECFQFRDWWLEYVLPPGRRDVFCKKLLFPKKRFLVSGYMLFRWTKKIFCPMNLIAMCVNDLRNNETVIVTSKKIDTGYTYFQRFFFITQGRLKYICGTKTNIILAWKKVPNSKSSQSCIQNAVSARPVHWHQDSWVPLAKAPKLLAAN